MRYAAHGINISEVEVTNISKHGIWLLVKEQELFMPFDQFPWFKEAPIAKILHVELPSNNHLYWPDLDIDVSLESILHPELFPLVSKSLAQL